MPVSPSPVPVLLHGFLGFSRIGPIEYFRGVAAALRSDGIVPLIPSLPAAGSVADRAAALADVLRRPPAAEYVLIAHSLGGLDARFLITHLDPGQQVKALVTVATPHRGTMVARHLLEEQGVLPTIARRFWQPALRDLDPDVRLNEPIPDRADVCYISYAAQRPMNELPLALRRFARLINEPNDGLVPVASTQWGRFDGVLHADHVELVGWSLALPRRATARPFNHLAFWRRAVKQAMASA